MFSEFFFFNSNLFFTGSFKIPVKNGQSMGLNRSLNDNSVHDGNSQLIPKFINSKITKLFLLAVSGQSVHTLSYNCHNNNEQPAAIHHLSHWLELRRATFELSIYRMMGLKNALTYDKISCVRVNKLLPKTKNNPDMLLDYTSYVAIVGDHESHNKINNDKLSQTSSRNNSYKSNLSKSINNAADDKKIKSKSSKKDVHDFYIEQLVRNSKKQRRIGKIFLSRWLITVSKAFIF